MAIGRPLNLTANVASKNISVLATAGQTSFTVTGGYRINEIAVYRNGTRLADGRDFTATDGSIVTLVSAATLGDVIEYQIFDSFNVANAVGTSGDSTIDGNLTATSFYGDGSNLSNVISGVELKHHDNSVGTAITQINFSGFGSVTAPVSGFSTVTVDRFLTIGARTGSAVTFSIADSSFIVENRSGGDVTINL